MEELANLIQYVCSKTIYFKSCVHLNMAFRPVAEGYVAPADHFPFLLSTKMSDLKAVVDRKDTFLPAPVQKAVKGDKGDGGESGPRGPSGADVSTTKSILEADEDPQTGHSKSRGCSPC